MNKPYFRRNFFLTDWGYKRLKNKIDLLLFYRKHFYGFSESVFMLGEKESLGSRLRLLRASCCLGKWVLSILRRFPAWFPTRFLFSVVIFLW